MTTIGIPVPSILPTTSYAQVSGQVATAVFQGLVGSHKTLPAWLFYDEAGSWLFEQITELPEYYLTRTERAIFAAHSEEIIACAAGAADGELVRLRIAELGAGSADKTRLLLKAASGRQEVVVYEPMDVSSSALEAARARIESEIPGIEVAPQVVDYMERLSLEPTFPGERRLVLYIGSSIGNFEPHEAGLLLRRIRLALAPGDGLLIGVDLRKDVATLLSAYADAAGVTAEFNLNILARLNRELGAEFELHQFRHVAVWNGVKSRIEMHLESRTDQRVRVKALGIEVSFAKGERIHTENSYKYAPGQTEEMLAEAGFIPAARWTDDQNWFAVCLGQVE
jgi:dimethylhistidine N-methyltransferase